MRHQFVSIFLLTLVCAALALTAWARSPGSTNGAYNCIVAGDFTGDGTVFRNGNSSVLRFRFQVRDEAGNRGELNVNVNVVNNHFAGEGTVMGVAMKIEGRLDPADQGREQLRGQRLVATFSDNNKHHGRITGSPQLRGNGNGNGNVSATGSGSGNQGAGSQGSGDGGDDEGGSGGRGDGNRGGGGAIRH